MAKNVIRSTPPLRGLLIPAFCVLPLLSVALVKGSVICALVCAALVGYILWTIHKNRVVITPDVVNVRGKKYYWSDYDGYDVVCIKEDNKEHRVALVWSVRLNNVFPIMLDSYGNPDELLEAIPLRKKQMPNEKNHAFRLG